MDRAYMFWNEFETIPSGGGVSEIEDFELGVDGLTISCDLAAGRFDITETGIYLCQVAMFWDNTFAGGKMARIEWIVTNALQDTNYMEAWTSEQSLSVNVDSVTCEALVFVDNIIGIVEGFECFAYQNSGVDQDLASVDFSIVRLSEYHQLSS